MEAEASFCRSLSSSLGKRWLISREMGYLLQKLELRLLERRGRLVEREKGSLGPRQKSERKGKGKKRERKKEKKKKEKKSNKGH